MRLVDAVVDDPDLQAPVRRSPAARLAPHVRRADELRRAVVRPGLRGRRRRGAERVVGHRRPHGRARHRAQARQLRRGDDDRDAVERHVVMPVDARVRHVGGEPSGERLLGRRERTEVRDRPRCPQVERAPLHHRKRCLREGDDHFDELSADPWRRGRATAGEQREERGGKDEKAESSAAQARMVRVSAGFGGDAKWPTSR